LNLSAVENFLHFRPHPSPPLGHNNPRSIRLLEVDAGSTDLLIYQDRLERSSLATEVITHISQWNSTEANHLLNLPQAFQDEEERAV